MRHLVFELRYFSRAFLSPIACGFAHRAPRAGQFCLQTPNWSITTIPASNVIRKFYEKAKPKLKHEIRPFDDDEIANVADAFAATIKARSYTCYGCAIMPDHANLLIRKHRDKAEDMIGVLQDESWLYITESKKWPSGHPIWGGPGWKVFLDSREDIERTIRYILNNPLKANRPAQIFEFVQENVGWLPGVGARKN